MHLQSGHASAGLVFLSSAWFQLGLLKLELEDPLLRCLAHIAGELGLALVRSPAGCVGSMLRFLSAWASTGRLGSLLAWRQGDRATISWEQGRNAWHFYDLASKVPQYHFPTPLLQEIITSFSGAREEK